MKEASSSPLFSPVTQNAGTGAAAAAAAEERLQVLPALRVKSPCCSSSTLSLSTPSSSSSVHSSNSSSSYFFSSYHLGSSPMVPSSPFVCGSSAIPFSWEKQPGVPKHSHRAVEHQSYRSAPGQRLLLPPPPPLRSNSDPFLSVARKKRPDQLRLPADPFAAALMECCKDGGGEYSPGAGPFWKGAPAAPSKAVGPGRRRTVADLFGFVDLYTSCKARNSVANSTVYVPRSGRASAVYGLLGRRAG